MMLVNSLLAAALCLLLLTHARAAARLTFEVDASEESTAIYHVACLSESLPCTKASFETFWHGQLRWTSADAQAIDAWRAIFQRVADAAPAASSAPFVGNTFVLRPSLQRQRELLAVIFEARSAEELQRRTGLSSEDARQIRRVVDHFRRRLAAWRRGGARHTRTRIAAEAGRVEALLRRPDLSTLVSRVAWFVEADEDVRAIHVHLVPSPASRSDAASATYAENHVVMEVTDEASTNGLAQVVLHEATHYLYNSAPPAKLRELMDQFVRTG